MIREAVAGITIPITVVPDVRGFDRAVREITTPTIPAVIEPRVDNERLNRSLANINTVITRSLGAIGGLTKLALAFGLIGISAAAAAQSVLAFSAALAPTVGILAALPAIVLGFVAANAALRLALLGVGDAFKAALTADAKAFEKSLTGLSKSATSAAKEVRTLKPAFQELRSQVQDAFFEQFSGQITATAKELAGPLKIGLAGISAEFGRAAGESLKFIANARQVEDLRGIMEGTRVAVGSLGSALPNVLRGFLAIGNAVSTAFGEALSVSIQNAASAFGNFLTGAAASGKAVEWVDGALVAFRQLGALIGNLGGILSGVFKAAEATTGGFLNNLVTITQSFETFVKSVEGQTALQNVFRTLATVAAQLGPIFSALVTQIGNIAPALTPLFLTISPAIVTLINALGPVLNAVLPGIQALFQGLAAGFNTLASSGALTTLGTAIAQIGKAIAPLLPVIAQLAADLGAALAPVVAALAPVLSTVVGVIRSLFATIQPLLPVIGNLVAQLGPILTPIIAALGTQFLALAPLVQTIANILSSVLGPILAALPGLIGPFADLLAQLSTALLPVFNDLLVQLQPSLIQVSQAVVQVIQALIPVITQFTILTGKILGDLMPILGPLISLLAQLGAGFIGNVARVLTTIVVPALNAVAALLRGDFSGAFKAMREVVENSLGFVKDAILALPRIIINAVGGFQQTLNVAGQDLIRGLIAGIKSMAGSLVSAAKGVVSDAVSGAKSLLGIKSPSRVFFVIGVQTGQGLVNGLDSMAAKVGDAASDMASAAVAPFSGLSVNGPTVNGMDSASALAAITQPFGRQPSQDLVTTRTSRQAGVQGLSGAGGPSIQNTFNITEVGDATATAERVVNRMVTAAGVFL